MTQVLDLDILQKSTRHAAILDQAERAGLMGGTRRGIGVRTPTPLLDAAKARSGLSSTTQVIEYALAKLAMEDDFGTLLLARRGTVSPDISLEF